MKSTAQYFLLALALLCVMGTHAFAGECTLIWDEDNNPICFRDCTHPCQLIESHVPGGTVTYSCDPCQDAMTSRATISMMILPAGENIAILRKLSK